MTTQRTSCWGTSGSSSGSDDTVRRRLRDRAVGYACRFVRVAEYGCDGGWRVLCAEPRMLGVTASTCTLLPWCRTSFRGAAAMAGGTRAVGPCPLQRPRASTSGLFPVRGLCRRAQDRGTGALPNWKEQLQHTRMKDTLDPYLAMCDGDRTHFGRALACYCESTFITLMYESLSILLFHRHMAYSSTLGLQGQQQPAGCHLTRPR